MKITFCPENRKELTNPLRAKYEKYLLHSSERETSRIFGMVRDISGLLFVVAVSFWCHPLAQAEVN
jgi:hypothetical protein